MSANRPPTTASQRRSSWSAFLLTTAARMVLSALGGMIIWTLLPSLLGWRSTVVMSGSMQPRIKTGDVVVSRTVDRSTLSPGEVLLVNSPDQPGTLRLHRFIRVDTHGDLVLRGDANRHDDSSPVSRNAVQGIASLRVPFVGRPVVWAKHHEYGTLAATVLALLALVRLATWYRPAGAENDETTEPDPRSGPPRRRLRTALRRWGRGVAGLRRPSAAMLRNVGAVLVVLILIGMAFQPGRDALSGYSTTTKNPTNGFTAAATFATCQSVSDTDNAYDTLPLADSTGTTAADTSGNSYTGTYHGTAGTQFKLAQAGPCPNDSAKAVTLVGSGTTGGSGGWVSLDHQLASAPTTFTIEVWFKTASGYANGGGLFGYGDKNQAMPTGWDREVYMSNNGILNFGVSNSSGDQYVSTTTSYNDGSWHLMDAQLSSAGQKLYVDGVLKASNASITTDNFTAAGFWRIGVVRADGVNIPTNYYFNGGLAFASAYSTALSATAISNHYAAGH